MILMFDTETTGFVEPTLPADHPSQPHLVQLGAVLLTDGFKELACVDLVVRPDGFRIPEAAARCHGITTEIGQDVGIPLASVMSVFAQLRANARECVAFNMKFDKLVVEAAFARLGRQPARGWPEKMSCCMEEASPVMELPPTARMKAAGFDKFKPPSLAEAHQYFLGEGFVNAHSAMADARAALRIWNALKLLEASCQ